jgi:hypothetical protein
MFVKLTGYSLALAEIKLTLVHFLFALDFEIVNGDSDWFNQKTYRVWQKKPVHVKLTKR